jgi:hypothetical protein
MHMILALLILNIAFWLYSWVIIFMEYQKFEKRAESGLPVFFPFQQFYFIYKKLGISLEFLFFSSINSSKLEKTG